MTDSRSEKKLTSEALLASPENIVQILGRFRDSLSAMVFATGANPAEVRKTARMLGVDYNVFWQMAQIINSTDVLSTADHIPTVKRFSVLCEACRQRGASDSDIVDALGAMESIEQVVEICAGSREDFRDLVRGMSNDDVTTRQEGARKAAFRAQSTLWGVRADVNFKTVMAIPNADDPGRMDGIRFGGLAGFKRLRPIPWSMFRMMAGQDDGTPIKASISALDPEIDDPQALPLLKRFCSDSLPEIRTVVNQSGRCFDIVPGLIGIPGSINCVYGDRVTDFAYNYRTEDSRYYAAVFDLQTPAEHLQLDLMWHQSLDFTAYPEVFHLDRLNAPRGYNTTADEWNRLPLSTTARQINPTLAGIATHHYPEYRDLLDYVTSTIGIPVEEFRIFRFEMTYPTIPSAVVLRTTLRPVPSSDRS